MQFSEIGQNIVASSDRGLFISGDNGESRSELIGLPAYVIAVNRSYALAGFNNNLSLSSDSGESWKEVKEIILMTGRDASAKY